MVALAGDDLFLRAGPEGGQVNRINLTTRRTLPVSIAFDGPAIFAASQTYVVWVHQGRLNVYDRTTAEVPPHPRTTRPPGAGANGAIGTLIGRAAPSLAYTSPTDGRRSRARQVRSCVDLTGNAGRRLGAEAFVAGDRIAWREGDHYTVVRTR